MRRLSITGLATLIVLVVQLQVNAGTFTPGNLAILRYGNGTEVLNTGVAVTAYIDEYTTAGVPVQSIPLPTTGPDALTAVGNASRDGIIQRTQDGKSIVLGGYRADQGAANPIANSPKVIGLVNVNGAVDTTTSFTNVLAANPIRSVASLDGASFYAAGDGSNSAVYVPYGASSTGVAVQSGPWRSVHVENTQLYGASGSTGNRGISTIGTGLPTTSQSNTILTAENQPSGGGPGVSSLDVANANIIYAAGSSLGTGDDFRRYVWNGTAYAGATNTTVLFPSGGAQTYGIFAIPDGLGGENVFMTTATALYKVVDSNPLSTNFASLALTKIADAPAGTQFRGLTGTPVPESSTITLLAIASAALLVMKVRRPNNKQLSITN